MKISITYMAQIKTCTDKGQETIELADGSRIQDLIMHLCNQYGKSLSQLLLTDEQRLRRVILIFIGDEQIYWDDNPPLSDQCEVSLMSPIAGGS